MIPSSSLALRRLGAPLALLFALCDAGTGREARADQATEPVTDPKEMARRHGEEALALHAEGRFAEAFTKFEMAEKIAHSPVFLLWMARSKRAQGALLAARSLYEQLERESLPSDASPNWVQAKTEGASELAALVPRIPAVVVRLGAGQPADLPVELDGARVQPGAQILVDPGEHVVIARPRASAPVERRVRVREGSPPAVVEIGASASPEVEASPSPGSIVPGAVLLGFGAAGIAAGIVTGTYALVLAGEVKDGCVGDACLASDEDEAATADALARASTGALIAGGALGVVGVVLLIVRPGGDAGVAFGVGPGHASFLVRF